MSYVGPLYQAAYLLGRLQLRALYRELVESGRMSAAEFHDAVLLGGPMPIEMVRARLTGAPITREFRSSWRFYGDPLRLSAYEGGGVQLRILPWSVRSHETIPYPTS